VFCPKCATQNIEGASFCRVCGANISLVPQALSGQLQGTSGGIPGRGGPLAKPPSAPPAVQEVMMGIGFVVVAILGSKYAPAGQIVWFSLLITALIGLGKGMSEIVRLMITSKQQNQRAQLESFTRPDSLAAPRTAELLPTPPSVTEGTTRHLGQDAATRHLDS